MEISAAEEEEEERKDKKLGLTVLRMTYLDVYLQDIKVNYTFSTIVRDIS
jgi:hypothetical protein